MSRELEEALEKLGEYPLHEDYEDIGICELDEYILIKQALIDKDNRIKELEEDVFDNLLATLYIHQLQSKLDKIEEVISKIDEERFLTFGMSKVVFSGEWKELIELDNQIKQIKSIMESE